MEILSLGEVLDRVAEVGGSLRLEGEHVALSLPQNCPPDSEVAIVESVRAERPTRCPPCSAIWAANLPHLRK